jgi:pimeloyl-ACP methyl ester carboxylesterase
VTTHGPFLPQPTVPSPYAAELEAIPVLHEVVEAAGVTTHFWIYGGDDAASMTLVAVHGFRGEHHGLEPVIGFLKGYRVMVPDLPGFGESDAFIDRDHSVRSYAEWLQAFVAALGLSGDVVLLGHSFGSIVSAAAVAGGLDASRLILVNPIAAPALRGPRGVLSRLAVLYYWFGAVSPELVGQAILRSRIITRLSSSAMVKTKSRTLRAWIHGQHDSFFSRFANRRVVLEAFTASVSSDVSTYAGRIAVPTLLIAAERDDITALSAQRDLRALFDDGQLEIVHGVGHLIHYEKPREAADLIVRFIGAQP